MLKQAVDWPLALNSLITITPGGAQVTDFQGLSSTGAPANGSSSSSATTAGSSGSSATTSASIGTVNLQVTGPGPSLAVSEAWINAVAGSKLFANPVQGATVGNPNGTISFPFTISVTPNASLDKNASLK